MKGTHADQKLCLFKDCPGSVCTEALACTYLPLDRLCFTVSGLSEVYLCSFLLVSPGNVDVKPEIYISVSFDVTITDGGLQLFFSAVG